MKNQTERATGMAKENFEMDEKQVEVVTNRVNEMLKHPEINKKYQSFASKDEADSWAVKTALATLIVPADKRIKVNSGDVVLIKNVPDGHYKDLRRLIYDHQIDNGGYQNRKVLKDFQHLNDYGFFIDDYNDWRSDKSFTGGFSGYIPYKTDKEFSCSGSGNSCKVEHLTFLKKDNAPYWNFADNMPGAGQGVIQFHEVNFFELDYNNLR